MKKFKLKPGQIDFSKARWAPVINRVLEYQGKILAVQRDKERSSLQLNPSFAHGRGLMLLL